MYRLFFVFLRLTFFFPIAECVAKRLCVLYLVNVCSCVVCFFASVFKLNHIHYDGLLCLSVVLVQCCKGILDPPPPTHPPPSSTTLSPPSVCFVRGLHFRLPLLISINCVWRCTWWLSVVILKVPCCAFSLFANYVLGLSVNAPEANKQTEKSRIFFLCTTSQCVPEFTVQDICDKKKTDGSTRLVMKPSRSASGRSTKSNWYILCRAAPLKSGITN